MKTSRRIAAFFFGNTLSLFVRSGKKIRRYAIQVIAVCPSR